MSSTEEKSHAPARNAKGNGLRKYEYAELAKATNSFSNDHYIAGGRFGDVYKGSLGAVDVAITKLVISRDVHWENKFQDLIKAFGTVHHENLVNLIGYCSYKSIKLLVSEFVSEESLKFYLYDKERRSNLTWPIRMKIAKDSAKGLAYLHEGSSPIIHGDINAANILLHNIFNSKVAEFGLANLYSENDHKNHPSQSVDVYSFGIVLLELIMGKNVAKKDIIKAKSLMVNGNYSHENDYAWLIDDKLKGYYDASEMRWMIHCVAISICKPTLTSMKQIVEVLEGEGGDEEMIDPPPHNAPAFKDDNTYGPKKFEYGLLANATYQFSNACYRGSGGFGVVYEASLPFQRHKKEPHKTHIVAIKKLTYKQDHNPGKEEFEKEIKAVGAARHRNLVELIGYCSTEHDKLLVLEFVSNKSLRYNLHGNKTLTLDWSKRMKIARSSAKALVYLHDDAPEKIIHGDIKADNILLTDKFESKIADFGLVKFFSQTDSVTHITTTVNKGTYIYADLDSKQVSEKSDVYSFGVVLLELLTGRDPFMDDGIMKWARPRMIEGDDFIKIKDDYALIVDSKLRGVYDESEVKQMVYCAVASVYKPPISRPTMKQIVQVLTGKLSPENLWFAESPPRQVNPDKKSRKPNPNEQDPSTLLQQFKYEDLASATMAFSGKYRRRADSCFEVYEGVISSGSNYKQNVAIKKHIHFSEQQKDEFEGEIETINKVRHRNIVKLIGYCNDEHNNRLLVFESTFGFQDLMGVLWRLINNLAEKGKNSADLLWPTRMKIAQGIANALKYMHEDCKPRILHLFVKSDNIFLNEKFEPKLAEFGSAEFFPVSATHVTIDKMMKDSGYLAPEYYSSNKKSVKFDVYSFGVILLELITGRQSVGEFDGRYSTLVNWFKKSPFKGKDKENFVDKKLKKYDIEQMDRMIACALACIHDNPQKRPQMGQILDVLEGNANLETLNLLSEETTAEKKSRKPNPNEQDPSTLLQQFKYEELASATKDFSGEYLRRADSCFQVYEGVISSGSNYKQNVAIKKLKHFSEQQKDEFEGEIDTINNVRHRNIVKLIGYCSDKHNNRLLVFESTSGKSLKSCLHAEGNSAYLLWPTRMKIAQGIANALKYMHEDCKPRILHLFVKSDNIFLNEKLEPKLAEFGSAEFFPESVTHLSIDKIMKNSGYLAPEYDSSNKKHLTDKFDVYSFGVILLELITGKQSVVECDSHYSTLVKWMLAMPQFKRSPFKGEDKKNFVDKKLKEYDIKQMDRMIACALACIHDNPQKRPQMGQILDVLEGNANLETLNLLSEETAAGPSTKHN